MTRMSPIQLDDPRAVSFRTPARRRRPTQPDRCTHRHRDSRCRNDATTDDGYWGNHDLERRRERALVAIVCTTDSDTTIAHATGLTPTDVRTLRWAWRNAGRAHRK
jgi:hypothetical protein